MDPIFESQCRRCGVAQFSPVVAVGFGMFWHVLAKKSGEWFEFKSSFCGTEVDKINSKIDVHCYVLHLTFHAYVQNSTTINHHVFCESIGRLRICIDDMRKHSLPPRFRESAYVYIYI